MEEIRRNVLSYWYQKEVDNKQHPLLCNYPTFPSYHLNQCQSINPIVYSKDSHRIYSRRVWKEEVSCVWLRVAAIVGRVWTGHISSSSSTAAPPLIIDTLSLLILPEGSLSQLSVVRLLLALVTSTVGEAAGAAVKVHPPSSCTNQQQSMALHFVHMLTTVWSLLSFHISFSCAQ